MNEEMYARDGGLLVQRIPSARTTALTAIGRNSLSKAQTVMITAIETGAVNSESGCSTRWSHCSSRSRCRLFA
jgi:hypothetical protein